MTKQWSPYLYTDEQLATINRPRLSGEAWELIERAISRSDARASIRRRKLDCTVLASPTQSPPAPALNPRGRAGPEPLPPMHPISWGAIALHASAPLESAWDDLNSPSTLGK
jgi:hypothetical protein